MKFEGPVIRMDVDAVLFDVNGTLVHIRTEDDDESVFRAAGHFLSYQGVDLRRHEVRDLYFGFLKEQQRRSPEEYPEFDVLAIWARIVEEHSTGYTRSLAPEKLASLPLALAELTRGVSRKKLKLYPHVRLVLKALGAELPLAVVTDAQTPWARAELHRTGILDFFDPVVVSGDHGFRKPDPRLFQLALDALGVEPGRAVYVGNDMHRDVYGAREVGLRTVMFNSDQGAKSYPGVVPDHTITDHRALLTILGLD